MGPRFRVPHEDPLRLLANGTMRALLAQLGHAPSYPRALASRMGLSEGDVQRKLHKLERAGLVVGEWRRREATVKEYRLAVASLRVEFADGDVPVHLDGGPAHG